MNKSENIADLAAALAKAQGAMQSAKRDSANPFFKSTYADLASVWDACRKPLADNGLCVTQVLSREGTAHTLETVLFHASGQWLCSTLTLIPKDTSPQAIGSVITYARRYALSAIVGVATEDDDAESASGRAARPDVRTAAGEDDQSGQPEKDTTGTGAKEQHWCDKHNVPFFKHGKMLRYAHPTAQGQPWCYLPDHPKTPTVRAGAPPVAGTGPGAESPSPDPPGVPPPPAGTLPEGQAIAGNGPPAVVPALAQVESPAFDRQASWMASQKQMQANIRAGMTPGVILDWFRVQGVTLRPGQIDAAVCPDEIPDGVLARLGVALKPK